MLAPPVPKLECGEVEIRAFETIAAAKLKMDELSWDSDDGDRGPAQGAASGVYLNQGGQMPRQARQTRAYQLPVESCPARVRAATMAYVRVSHGGHWHSPAAPRAAGPGDWPTGIVTDSD